VAELPAKVIANSNSLASVVDVFVTRQFTITVNTTLGTVVVKNKVPKLVGAVDIKGVAAVTTSVITPGS
jgi:hypothetical protein